jgi:hypothetical protein
MGSCHDACMLLAISTYSPNFFGSTVLEVQNKLHSVPGSFHVPRALSKY